MKILLLSVFLSLLYPGKRQILLFYNDAGLAMKDKQLSTLNADKQGLVERDIVVHSLKTNDEKVAAAKWKVNPGKAFIFILVGKDGGEKLRSDTIISPEDLYKTIDAMPLRRNEMKEKN